MENVKPIECKIYNLYNFKLVAITRAGNAIVTDFTQNTILINRLTYNKLVSGDTITGYIKYTEKYGNMLFTLKF